jgi:hypothetical protein
VDFFVFVAFLILELDSQVGRFQRPSVKDIAEGQELGAFRQIGLRCPAIERICGHYKPFPWRIRIIEQQDGYYVDPMACIGDGRIA